MFPSELADCETPPSRNNLLFVATKPLKCLKYVHKPVVHSRCFHKFIIDHLSITDRKIFFCRENNLNFLRFSESPTFTRNPKCSEINCFAFFRCALRSHKNSPIIHRAIWPELSKGLHWVSHEVQVIKMHFNSSCAAVDLRKKAKGEW